MSFDPSKQLYLHFKCNTIPCSCTYEHKPLESMLFKCSYCNEVFYTINLRSEHHLVCKARPVEEFIPVVPSRNGTRDV